MSGTSGDDGGSGGLLRLLAVGDFVGVALEIFRGPRSGANRFSQCARRLGDSGPVCERRETPNTHVYPGHCETTVAEA